MGPDRDLRGDAAQQETGKTYLKAIIDQAKALGNANVIGLVYSAVGRADAVEDKEKPKQWKTVVKNLKDVKVGDTITDLNAPTATPLPGYKEPKPMVYSGVCFF